jgi:hypothetical protein
MKSIRAILAIAVLAFIPAFAQAEPLFPTTPSCNGSGCDGGKVSTN